MNTNMTRMIDLWHCILGDDFRERFIFDYDGYKLSGGGSNYIAYDLTLGEDVYLTPESPFCLSFTSEHLNVPNDWYLELKNKSTLARLGIDATGNTIIDNGYKGYITLEIESKNRYRAIKLEKGMPIVKIVAHTTPLFCKPYDGKYQDQPKKVVGAK
jgi:deoxycytidine triphosphate deaminase